MSLLNEINGHRLHLNAAEEFLNLYPQIEEISPVLAMDASYCMITIYCYDNNRERVLSGVGELLGRDGWITEDSYCGKFLHWIKMFGNVKVKLDDAQPLDHPPIGIPVPPQLFPVMLRDIEPVTLDTDIPF